MGKNILIFIAGIITGVVLTFVVAYTISKGNTSEDRYTTEQEIKYLENEINYEGKKSTSFKVFQVLDNCALANEYSGYGNYFGKTVLLKGNNTAFYSDQEIKIKNPIQVGIYSYKNQGGMEMTVPVIDISK